MFPTADVSGIAAGRHLRDNRGGQARLWPGHPATRLSTRPMQPDDKLEVQFSQGVAQKLQAGICRRQGMFPVYFQGSRTAGRV